MPGLRMQQSKCKDNSILMECASVARCTDNTLFQILLKFVHEAENLEAYTFDVTLSIYFDIIFTKQAI